MVPMIGFFFEIDINYLIIFKILFGPFVLSMDIGLNFTLCFYSQML
jgi:hypothetical protein